MLVLVLVLERILEASRAEGEEMRRGRGTYPGGCCVRSPGRLARRRTSQCGRQGVDNGRPTLREQRDGVWGIFGAWVREWAGMTRGGERPGMCGGEYATIPCKRPASDN